MVLDWVGHFYFVLCICYCILPHAVEQDIRQRRHAHALLVALAAAHAPQHVGLRAIVLLDSHAHCQPQECAQDYQLSISG